MTIPKCFLRSTLPSAPVAVTVPAGRLWIVTNIIATSASTNHRAISVELDDVLIVHQLSLEPSALLTLDLKQVLPAGGRMEAWADASSSVHCHISGVEVTL